MDDIALERVFREEYGRIIATLIRISGSFDLAEEALQEAFTSAASKWASEGTPDNPGAWLTTVAHRKLLDALRRDQTRTDKQPELAFESARLQNYYLFHASRADLLRRLNRFDEATAAYEQALSLTTNEVEQNYIRKRLAELDQV